MKRILSLQRLAAIVLAGVAGFCVVRFWPAPEFPVTADSVWEPLAAERPEPGIANPADRLHNFLTDNAPVTAARFATSGADEFLRPALIERWSAEDPAGFWKWIKAQKDPGLLAEAGPVLFKMWAARDAAAAFAATGEIASSHLRDPLRMLVIEAVLGQDFAAGMALAAKCGPLLTGSPGTGWMRQDPVAAVRALSEMAGSENSFRSRYLRAALRILAKENPVALAEWLESQPRLGASTLDAEYFRGMPAAAAVRSMAAAAALPPGQNRDQVMRGSIVAMASQLPATEIIALATQNLAGWERADVLADAAKAAVRSDPVKAAAILQASPPSRYSQYAVDEVAAGLMAADWQGARAWADTLPDAVMTRKALQSISRTIPPDQAPGFAAGLSARPVEEWSDDLLRNAHKQLDPQAAARWIATLPPDRAAWVQEVVKKP